MKRLFALFLAALVMLPLIAVSPAIAAEDITIAFPEKSDLQVTITDPYETYSYAGFVFNPAQMAYSIYINDGSTVTFSADATLVFTDMTTYAQTPKTFTAGSAVTSDEINGGALYLTDDTVSGPFATFMKASDPTYAQGVATATEPLTNLAAGAQINAPAEAPADVSADTTVPEPSAGGGEHTFTYEGVEISATDIQSNYYLFDLAAAGFGTGIVYALYFEDSGTITFSASAQLTSFDAAFNALTKDVAAGETLSVSDVNGYSYALGATGNSLCFVQASNPLNYTGLINDRPLSEVDAALSGSAPAPAPVPAPAAPVTPEAVGYPPLPETYPEGSKVVTVSISLEGKLILAAYPIALESGSDTIIDAFKAAHDLFYEGGAEAGFADGIDPTYNSYTVLKAWGVAANPSIILNHGMLSGAANEAATLNGDNIIFSISSNPFAGPTLLSPFGKINEETGDFELTVRSQALDYASFAYIYAAVPNATVTDFDGNPLGTTDIDGKLVIPEAQANGVAIITGSSGMMAAPGAAAIPIDGSSGAVGPDYTLFGGRNGRSLAIIVFVGLGAAIPLFVIVLIAQNKELKSGGVKFAQAKFNID